MIPAMYRWCDDDVPLNPNDPGYMSINQKLAGGPNPKTLIPTGDTSSCRGI